jgi:hypothetical protein
MDETKVADVPQEATQAAPSAAKTGHGVPESPKADNAAAANDRTINYKYNHSEEALDLSKEEDMQKAAEYLREGRYYLEKGKEKLAGYENDEGYMWFSAIAKQFGVTTAELAKKWGADLENKIVGEYAQAHGLSPQSAKKELQGNAVFMAMTAEMDAMKTLRQRDEAINAQIDELIEANPGIDISKIPDEMLELAKAQDIPLRLAYTVHQSGVKDAKIAEMEKQLGIQAANEANADSSMGKAAGAAFGGEMNEDVIKNMTSAQRQANMPKILAWMHRKKT